MSLTAGLEGALLLLLPLLIQPPALNCTWHMPMVLTVQQRMKKITNRGGKDGGAIITFLYSKRLKGKALETPPVKGLDRERHTCLVQTPGPPEEEKYTHTYTHTMVLRLFSCLESRTRLLSIYTTAGRRRA